MQSKRLFSRLGSFLRGEMRWKGPRHYVVRGMQIVFLVLLVGALVVWLAKYLLAWL